MAEPVAPLWALLALAVGATFVWRLVGVVVAGGLTEDGPLFRWIAAVAYAMVAGLMTRVILMPGGAFAWETLWPRALALAVAFLAWWLRGRSLVWGLAGGVGAYGLLTALGL